MAPKTSSLYINLYLLHRCFRNQSFQTTDNVELILLLVKLCWCTVIRVVSIATISTANNRLYGSVTDQSKSNMLFNKAACQCRIIVT